MSTLTTSLAAGENEYQTVLGEGEHGGSPASSVAVVLSTWSLNGSPAMTVALPKLSLAGGAANAIVGEAKITNAKPNNTPAKRPKACLRMKVLLFQPPCRAL